jgi:SRSO17 transposase
VRHCPDTIAAAVYAVTTPVAGRLRLDHFEGRSWHGLHHHAVLTMIAFAFLQTTRVRQNKA